MLLDAATGSEAFELDSPVETRTRWGAWSETGRLTEVLLAEPVFLKMVPCNTVTRDCLAKGYSTSRSRAVRQHDAFAEALRMAGVRSRFVPPKQDMPDLCFTRDSLLMTPWGAIELRLAAPHRRAEASHASSVIRGLGVPLHDRIEQGTIEGGDICLLRDGLAVIGISGDRTNDAGAAQLGSTFAKRDWEVVEVRFDPKFLHLDTIFTMASDDCAVACPDALPHEFLKRLGRLGITVLEASIDEVSGLGANLLALGEGRVIAPSSNGRLNALLARHGLDVIEVEIDEFTRCGGGPHCLTMPLARLQQE